MDCTVENCSYNQNEICHAIAITIGDLPQNPACDTYCQSSAQGGVPDMTAGVGACKTSDCRFNKCLECTAEDIQVGMQGGEPDCLTFEMR